MSIDNVNNSRHSFLKKRDMERRKIYLCYLNDMPEIYQARCDLFTLYRETFKIMPTPAKAEIRADPP